MSFYKDTDTPELIKREAWLVENISTATDPQYILGMILMLRDELKARETKLEADASSD